MDQGIRTVLLHNLQKLDDDLGGGTDDNLALAAALSVGDVHQGVVEDRNHDHFGRRL
jgi:hypothetical protein